MANQAIAESVARDESCEDLRPSEADALRVLDSAKAALSEIKEMKGLVNLVEFTQPQDTEDQDIIKDTQDLHVIHEEQNMKETEEENTVKRDEEGQTKSEVELKELTEMVEASLPKSQPDEKPLSRLSIADKKTPIQFISHAQPSITVHLVQSNSNNHDNTSVQTSLIAEEQPLVQQETSKRRWSILKKMFNKKSNKN